MKIYYNDGGVLNCSELNISAPDLLIADDTYYIRTDEIYSIREDDAEDFDAEEIEDGDDFELEIQDEPDYGPSNPWDAPGMSVSDFIRGVH